MAHILRPGDNRHRSASPRRSESPDTAGLPTRTKVNADRSSANPSMSIRVSGQDGEPGHGRGSREHSHHDEREGRAPDQRGADDYERERRSANDDGGEPMDEDDDLDVEDDGMGDMAAMMGFGGFGSTKGKKVVGNNVGAVSKEKKTEYRQYMNRQGGFNRPLSPSR